MKKFAIRYIAIVFAMTSFFSTFIACGSKMYQVSVEDDIEPENLPPEASDPNSTLFGIHGSWQQLPITFYVGEHLNDDQIIQIRAAMVRWETAVGRDLFEFGGRHQGTSGDTFQDLYSSLNDLINGNYLDGNWAKTGKSENVLATTIWQSDTPDSRVISRADIRFNEQTYLIGDSLALRDTEQRVVVDLWSLAQHELGHMIGLVHVNSDIDAWSVMNPSLFIGEGQTTRKLSKGDIERVQQLYGCQDAACDVDNLFTDLEREPDDPHALVARKLAH